MHVLAGDGTRRTVEMAARYKLVPLRWTAEQTNDPARPHIAFHHVAGPTRGMNVEWLFEPLDATRTRVRIVHRLTFRFPVFAELIGRHIVAGFFIHGVARLTLAQMKRLAEAATP